VKFYHDLAQHCRLVSQHINLSPPRVIKLLTCIRVMVDSNLGRDTVLTEAYHVFFLVLQGKFRGSASIWMTTAALCMFSNSSFDEHPTIRHYVA
jgi:hypothetical protein